MEEAQADPSVVQQVMFNRVLALMRSLSCDRVTVVGFDTKAGTVEGCLAGVNFVVSVNVRDSEPV